MKKNILLFVMGMLVLTSCHSKKSQEITNAEAQKQIINNDEQMVGCQKDDHDCLASAGETWSDLKNSCIQVFNLGERLDPIEINKEDAVISAFVVFNDDKSKLELFLPSDGSNHTILKKTEKDIYKDKIYTYNDKESVLYINGIKKFASE